MKLYFPQPETFNADKIHKLCDLVNHAYFLTDSILSDPKIPRTNFESLLNMIIKQELMVAEFDECIVGCVNVKKITNNTTFFSLLVAHPQYRKQGIGKQLVAQVESWAKANDSEHVCLELLRPKNWIHEHKEFLKKWYTRLGYIKQDSVPKDIDEILAPSRLYFSQYLLTPCDFFFFSKKLHS